MRPPDSGPCIVPTPPERERARAFLRAFRPVLLVDDRDWDRAALAAALLASGFLPQTARNVERALVFLTDPVREAEALVVPASLAGRSALAEQARQLRPGILVLVVEKGSEVAPGACLNALLGRTGKCLTGGSGVRNGAVLLETDVAGD